MAHPRWLAAVLTLWLGWSCAAAPQGDAQAQSEDLAAFTQSFFAIDRSYSPSARAEAEQRLSDLRSDVGHMSDVRFILSLAQIAALADNGHTAMLDLGAAPGLARAGIRLTSFGEDFFVVRSTTAHADLLGSRLITIDGTPMSRLRDAARTLRGGIPAWRDRFAPLLFESPGELFALGLTRSPDSAIYRFQSGGGTTRDVTLSAVTDPPRDGRGPVQDLDPAQAGRGWQTLLPENRAPWSLRDFSTPFRRRDAPELDAIVIQLHANTDIGGESIAQFLAASEADRRAARRQNVVLDMRFNGGGNLMLTRAFMSSWPSRLPPNGRIVVLTSPWTFSAAISSIGYLKQAGGDRVVLVGEAPGDRLQFWAEGRPIQLPRSGAVLLVATARHDYLTGCRTVSDCHPAVREYPIAVRSLAPEVPAPWTIEAYATGGDPGMDAAARVLSAKRGPGS